MKRITFLFTLMLLAFSTQGWAQSRNGFDFTDEEGNWYLMLEDFEGTAPEDYGSTKDGNVSIEEESGNKFMKYGFKAWNNNEYAFVDISLPDGVSLSDDKFSELQFDIMYKEDAWQKPFIVKIGESNSEAASATQIGSFNSGTVRNIWFTQNFNGSLPPYASFRLFIGGFEDNSTTCYIDNIRLKYEKEPTPTDTVAVESVSLNKTTTTITVGGSETLFPTFTPLNATNRDVTWESNNKDVATVDNDGTVHGIAVGTAIITVTTKDGNHTATCEVTVEETSSMNGQLYFDGTNVCLMVEDFEGSPVISLVNDKGGNASLKDITISDKTTKALKYETGKDQGDEYVAIKVALPAGKTLSDVYSDLIFDVVYDGTGSDNNYKQVKICLNETSNTISNAQWGEAVTDNWVLKSYSLSGKYTNENIFTLLVGGVYSNGMKYYIDNIRLKLANAGKCGDNALWVYDNQTLTISGEGATNNYDNSSATPWQSKRNDIVSVVVEDGITSIGNHSFSDFSNVNTIDFNSPNLSQIGGNVFQSINQNAKITLKSNPTIANQNNKKGTFNLVLNDAEKPFMAANSENTYNNVTYTRNYTSSYSTTILPFAPGTVEGVKYYTITNATDNSVTFTTVDHPEANKPYLIRLTAVGEKEFSAAKVTTIPANQTEVSTSTANWTMTGRYVTVVKKADDNAYGFSGGQLYRNTGNMTVNPFRAYFTTASSNAKAVMDVEFSNTPTAINNLENGSFEFNEVYNLNGVRQNSLQNGVNIVKMANGKTMKVILNK